MQPSNFDHQRFIGKSFGTYQILSYLGGNSLYHGFKAFSTNYKRVINLKIFNSKNEGQENSFLALTNKLNKYAILRHPNIIQLFGFDQFHGYLYSVSEYIDGITLKNAVSKEAFISSVPDLSLGLRIVYSIALALAYAHQRNLTHGSICPLCVLLEESGRITLSDFGMGELLYTGNSKNAENNFEFLRYASPERYAGEANTVQGDIYSLGAMFFHLVTGHLPGRDSANPSNPRDWVPDIPESVENVIMKCIDPDQKSRYKSVPNVIADITNIRLQDKTVNLPTANLSELAEDSDKMASWEPTDRTDFESLSQVCLHFVDTGQILNLDPDREYVIGRKYPTQSIKPDIDLSPYSSYEWGISRLHAKVNTRDGKAIITDIGSSNGTWHAGNRLETNKAYEFQHGDVVFLGKLKIQILMYT